MQGLLQMGVRILESPPSALTMPKNTPCRGLTTTTKKHDVSELSFMITVYCSYPNPGTEITGYHDHYCSPGRWNTELKQD